MNMFLFKMMHPVFGVCRQDTDLKVEILTILHLSFQEQV